MSYKVIDADRHVSEPSDLWEKYLPSKYKKYAPKIDFVDFNNEEGVVVDEVPVITLNGLPLFKNFSKKNQLVAISENNRFGDPSKAALRGEGQIKWMDKQGVDTSVLSPSMANYCVYNNTIDADLSRAFAKSYNLWIRDYCISNPERLIGCALISRHDPEKMTEDLKTIINQGFKTLVIRSEPIKGLGLDSPALFPFWAACEAHNISISFHGGTHLQAPTVGSDRFSTRFVMHACSHPMELQMAFLSVLQGGVLEKHPKLKFAFLEAGCSWVPYWLYRLDIICYEESYHEVKDVIKMKPSEYFKRQCWVGLEIGEPCIQDVINYIGVDKLLFGTDFPHPDHLDLAVQEIGGDNCPLKMDSFSDEDLEQILEKNPKRFFNIN